MNDYYPHGMPSERTFEYSQFLSILEELSRWINSDKIYNIFNYMCDEAIENNPNEVYSILREYFQDKYLRGNSDYEDYTSDSEAESDLEDYNLPFEITDNEEMKSYLLEFIDDTCGEYGDHYKLLKCSITDNRLLPLLSNRERLKTIDYMLDLSVTNENILEISKYLQINL